MVAATPTVYIVDDDPQVCESLSLMVHSVGFEAKTYTSAEAFLDDVRRHAKFAEVHGARRAHAGAERIGASADARGQEPDECRSS